MDFNYSTCFNEFKREYEVQKSASDDVLNVSLEIIHYIEMKLKKIYKWLKKYIFPSVQDEIYFFKELKPRMVSKLLYYKGLLNLEKITAPNPKRQKKAIRKTVVRIK